MDHLDSRALRGIDRFPRSRTYRTLLCLALICSLLLPSWGLWHSPAALAAGNQVSLWKTGNIQYSSGSWNAHMFLADDGEGASVAYCVEPAKNSPPEGVYAKSDIHCVSGRDYELKVDLWFAYGGPGFDPLMWPTTNWQGDVLSEEDYYLASHILLADTYSSNAYKSTYGAGEDFKEWIALNITGFDLKTGELISPMAVGRQAWARAGEVPSDFSAFQIDGGAAQTIATFTHYDPRGTMKISKQSANPNVTDGNVIYTMEGITYAVYDAESCTPDHDTGQRLVLDGNGYAEIECRSKGDRWVREVESSLAGTGFAYNPTPMHCKVEFGKDNWVVDASGPGGATSPGPVIDEPITYDIDVLIQKHDILTRSSCPSGDGSLANAVFEVKYFANLFGDASSKPTRSWTFKTDDAGRVDLRNGATEALVSGDGLYRNPSSHEVLFPLGTYSIQELTAPASYEPPTKQDPIVITLTATGTGAHDVDAGPLGDSGLIVQERPVRHDLSFTKRDLDTQRPMANIPFLVSRIGANGSLIERHVIVTDGNGMFSSSADRALHTTRTNANDDALISSSTGSRGVREERLDPDAGIWFGVASNGAWTQPNNDMGAFPDSVTCKYVFEELPVKANEGKALVRFEAYAHGARPSTIDLGTVGNTTPTLATVARDGIDGDKLVSKEGAAWVLDAVSYTGLVAGNTYTLRGTLVNATESMPVLDTNGRPYEPNVVFTPTATSGTLDMDFIFDTSTLANGDKVVVCEELYEGDRLLATHDEWHDSSQTVTIVEPAIQTQACDALDGDSIVVADIDARINDRVSYTGLIAGDTYVLTATLMDQETGLPFSDESGIVTSSIAFVPEHSSGEETLSLAFDASGLPAGKKLTVFETLAKGGAVVAAHEDLNDACQTVTAQPPALQTQALDPADGDNVAAADIAARIVDTVVYNGLAPGHEYELRAKLIDKETGYPLLDPFERPVEASHRFVPLAREGQTEVPIEFDASHLDVSRGAVVFEELWRNGKLIASHVDLNSVEQAIVIEPPSIETFASVDGVSKSIMRDEGVTLLDEVTYRNLQPGATYHLVGTLVRKRTGEPLLDAANAPVASALDFVPGQTNGSVSMSFDFDATTLSEGDELVVYERLMRDGVQIAKHEDPMSERQSIQIVAPRISTYAISLNGSKDLVRDSHATVLDTVSFQGLMPGREYLLTGTLMDAATGSALLDANGVEVTAQTTFIPDAAAGDAMQSFTFDASLLDDGQSIVVFERLERNGVHLASHEDIDDAAQTVIIVPIHIETYASDPADGDKLVGAHTQTKVLDAVSYDGLEPGVEYTLVGTLMGADTNEPLLTAQGNPAQASRVFTPQSKRGTVDVVFSFDASDKDQQQDAVIFQELYRDEALVARHADLQNAAQTVTVAPIKIETYASDAADGDKEIALNALETVTDSVSYLGLTPGRNYEMRGTLMLDDGPLEGKPLRDTLGGPVESRLAFTPDSTQGVVNLSFDIDTSALWDGARIVVFEELFCEQTSLATHQDLQDEDQALRVVASPAVPTPEDRLPDQPNPLGLPLSIGGLVNTGDAGALLLLVCGAIACGALGVLYWLRKRSFENPRRDE